MDKYYETDLDIYNSLKWEKEYKNPVEISEMIGAFIDNCEAFAIHMWVTLDDGIYINITEKNANDIIKYLYERFPY